MHTTNEEPVYETITAADFQEKMRHPGYVVIDVRTEPEWHSLGYIYDSRKLDVFNADFEKEVEKFDKRNAYLVYCLKGIRSVEACKIMAKHGFKKLYNLEGGLEKWEGPLAK